MQGKECSKVYVGRQRGRIALQKDAGPRILTLRLRGILRIAVIGGVRMLGYCHLYGLQFCERVRRLEGSAVAYRTSEDSRN